MATAMRDRWSDERLDDLKGSVDDGFRRMDERFARIDTRLDTLQHTLVRCFVAFAAAVLAGFISLFAVIATQL